MGTFGGAQPIVTDGLVFAVDAANYQSYPGSGTTWGDMVEGNDGTLINGPTFDSGNGGSIVFDGSDDYVDFNDLDIFDFTSSSEFTFSFWFKTDTTLDNENTILTLCDKSTSNQNPGFAFWLRGSSTYKGIVFRVRRTEGLFDIIPTNNLSSLVSNNKYHNVSITYIDSEFILYLDSESVGELYGSPTFDFTNTTPFKIGGTSTGTQFNYGGNISFGNIYNRALTAQEVSQNYNALKSRFGL